MTTLVEKIQFAGRGLGITELDDAPMVEFACIVIGTIIDRNGEKEIFGGKFVLFVILKCLPFCVA